MMFLLQSILFLISQFVIFVAILHFKFSVASHLKYHQFVLVFFLQRPSFTVITQVTIMSRLVFMLMIFAFPDGLELCHYSCCSSYLSSYLLAAVVVMC